MAEQYQHLAEMEPENFVGNLALQHGLNEAQRQIEMQPSLLRDFKQHQYNPNPLIDVGLVPNSRYG